MTAHCCEMMRLNVENTCDLHPERFDCPDCLIDFSQRLSAYGLIIHDGGGSVIGIQFCPWCGTQLPEAKEADLDAYDA